MRPRILLRFVLLSIVVSQAAYALELTVIGFNVESGGADPNVVAGLVEDRDGTHIWGFSEVQNSSWMNIFLEAAAEGEGASFEGILGSTGGADHLTSG